MKNIDILKSFFVYSSTEYLPFILFVYNKPKVKITIPMKDRMLPNVCHSSKVSTNILLPPEIYLLEVE